MNREAVKDLVIAYGEFLEAENYSEEATAAVFADDCTVKFAVGGDGTGIEEISKKHQGMMESFVGAHHNITNVLVKMQDDTHAQVSFHMEVIHEFRPEIAANLPGNLFIVNDRIAAVACKRGDEWKFTALEMNTVYKRMLKSM